MSGVTDEEQLKQPLVSAPTELSVQQRLAVVEAELQRMRRAFVRDELGEEDYAGHRKDHATRKREAEVMDEYKQTVTKRIINVVLGVVLTALGTGIVQMLMARMQGGK